MTSFLTVKEAAQRIGRSPSSIHRLIEPIKKDDHHPDRVHVQPSPEDVVQLRTAGVTFAWRVSEDFLLSKMPPDTGAEKGSDTPPQAVMHAAEQQLIEMLRQELDHKTRELDIKNEQITHYVQANTRLLDTINSLSERLHEGNILMGSLQQQLKLADGRGATTTAQPVKAPKRATATRPEKGTAVAVTATKPAPVTKASKPVKKGFFSRLFGG